MGKPLRIFVSSPGDVDGERRRAGIVIADLRKTYARFFDIEPILWEREPMLASGHFQDQITPPGETDIVVVIVWSRLGTPLPEKTETREYRGIDGRAPVTGTEWEFEDALASQKRRGAPDLLAYRKQVAPLVSLKDRAARTAAEEQWEKLEAFWSRWFINRGEFRTAFGEFVDLDGFEAKLKSDLRKLIERRISDLINANQAAPVPTWLAGSPFRGLDAYLFEHAPIFFGRSAATRAAVEQLTTNAEHGRGFLLIIGASGSGKSSLAQAGVLPALADPGVVTTVGLWRRARLRPGGHAGGPFAGLAEALVGQTALPELLAGRQDTTSLARHLKGSVDDPAFSIVTMLNQIEDAARGRGELLAIEKACLVLLVDQLEELFTTSAVTAEERTAFIRCLDGLARSGRVYVLATMRSDYWHLAAETPLLVEMAAGNARLDLLPATQDEIIEMIRRPAEAAGIEFETDPARDIGLDATIAAEASNEPGALPLTSFLLDELYKRDSLAGRSTLTFASARELGGLKGAIANRAEAVLAKLPEEVKAALPRVLRTLVTVNRSGAEATARPAALAQFADGSAERQLIAALLDPDVRLLVADGDGASARVRLSHEALITHWDRAKRQIGQDRRDLETRDLIDQLQARWAKASAGAARPLLLRDPDLANAIDLTKRWGAELDEKTRAFVAASRQRARRLQQLVAGAAAVFAMLAVGAAALGLLALQWEQRAEHQRNLAEANAVRIVASNSRRETDRGHADTGLLLALAALPHSPPFDTPPWTIEAESALYTALADLHGPYPIGVLSTGKRLVGGPIDLGNSDGPHVLAGPTANDRILVSVKSAAANILSVWQLPSRQKVMELPPREFRSAHLDPGGQVLAIVSNDGDVDLIDVSSGHTRASLGRFPELKDVFLGRNGRVLIHLGDKSAQLIDPVSGWRTSLDGGAGFCSVSLSHDGNQIAAATADGMAVLWRFDGSKLRKRASFDQLIQPAGFSIDGRDVQQMDCLNDQPAVFSNDDSIVARLTCRQDCLLPDGLEIVRLSSEQVQTEAFDIKTSISLNVGGTPRSFFPSYSKIKFSADGMKIFFQTSDDSAAVIDLSSSTPRPAYVTLDKNVTSIDLDRDGRQWLLGFNDGSTSLWERNGDRLTLTSRISPSDIESLRRDETISFAANSSFLSNSCCFLSSAKNLTVWHFESALHDGTIDAKPLIPLRAGDLQMSEVRGYAAFSPNSTVVASIDGNDYLTLTRTSDLEQTKQIDVSPERQRLKDGGDTDVVVLRPEGFGTRLAFSADGSIVVTASLFGVARVWNVDDGSLIAELRGHTKTVRHVAFNKSGSQAITASDDGSVRIWNARTGQEIKRFEDHIKGVFDARFSPDERYLATASEDGTVILYDLESGTKRLISRFAGWAYRTAFSPDGRFLAVITQEPTVSIFEVATGSVQTLRGHTELVWRVSFSDDGTSLLTASNDGTARLWRVSDGHLLQVFGERGLGLGSAAFIDGGRRVLTSSYDRTVRVWDTGSGVELLRLTFPQVVLYATLSPDSRKIAVACEYGRTELFRWFPTPADLIDFARIQAPRELTAAEHADFGLAR